MYPYCSAGYLNIQPIISWSAIVGIESHPTPKLEFDAWGGDEYYFRTTTPGAYNLVGYGSPFAAAATKQLLEGTAVLWYDMFKGSFGTLRYGAQYEYIERTTWSANDSGSSAVSKAYTAPKGIDNVGMLSMRYILP